MLALARLKKSLRATPKSMLVLIATEIPELFGRFGIMTTIALYLTKNLQQTDATAVMVFSTYLMLAAVTPMIGGVLADRLLGYKPAIMLGAVMMIIGNLLMVIPTMLFLYIGLAILVAGTGLFSPSLAALVSHLYRDQEQKRDKAFIAYYVAKNVGALLAPPLCGVIGVYFGYNSAFLLTTFGMIVGALVFMNYHCHLPDITPTALTHASRPLSRLFAFAVRQSVLASAVVMSLIAVIAVLILTLNGRSLLLAVSVVATLLLFLHLFRVGDQQHRRHLGVMLLAIMALVAFLSMNHLCGASFNLFVERVIDRHVFSINIPTSVFYAIDPLFMLAFGALIAKSLSRIQRPNYIVACFSKFTLAMLVFALAMLCFVIAAAHGAATGSAPSYYVVLCYSLCATSELCIVPIALSLITKLAPIGQTGLAVGLFSFSDVIASYFTGVIAKTGDIPFAVHSLRSRQMAAAIYHGLFSHLTVVLIVVAVGLFLVRVALAYRLTLRLTVPVKACLRDPI